MYTTVSRAASAVSYRSLRCAFDRMALPLTTVASRNHIWAEPERHLALGQLSTHDDRAKRRDDDSPFQHQRQACRLVSQRSFDPHPEGAQRYEHDGLDSDAAQDVADRDVDLPVERRGERDRDLGQVRRHGQ